MDEQSFKLSAPGAIILGAVIVAAAIVYTNYEKIDTGDQEAQLQQEVAEVTVDDDAILGDPDAPITVIEFSDYQCPFCRSFWKDTLPLVIGEYVTDGKVKIVYRDFPLSSHPMAVPYAEAAECAGDQDKYWEMHDIIFSEQEKLADGIIESLTVEDLSSWTEILEMDREEFDTCMEEHRHLEEVQKDFVDGDLAGVTGTPTFFINGEKVVGALPFEAFQTIIEEKLAE